MDQLLIFDNSEGKHKLIAEKNDGEQISIIREEEFNQIRKYYEKGK